MPATLEVIRERVDELRKQLDETIAKGGDVSALQEELNLLLSQYTAAQKMVSEGKTLLKG